MVLFIVPFCNMTHASDEPFYRAWSIAYQTKRVEIKNAYTYYGNGGMAFYSPANELYRRDAKLKMRNVEFNIEEVSKYHFVQASTSLALGGKSIDSVVYYGSSGEPLTMKITAGPAIGKFGIQAGLVIRMVNLRLGYPESNDPNPPRGYFYGNPGAWGLSYFDRMSTLHAGIGASAVFQFTENNGIRVSAFAGRMKNEKRNIKGNHREFEVKLYHTFPNTKNLGCYIGYRMNIYNVNGANEEVIDNGNSGSLRFPSSQWKQTAITFGLNLPINFD
jgi:hypothetical protein